MHLESGNFNYSMEDILTYFPQLTPLQRQQFEALEALYREWNEKINVVSRKDIDALYLHHVLHSLAIGKSIRFKDGTRILDVGTGGGFPGIPLAILFPNCLFKLIDGRGKKIVVASDVAKRLGLSNVEVVCKRAEDEKDKFHFVVSRAVMPLPDLIKLVRKNILLQSETRNGNVVVNALPNGVFCLKGGNIESEIKSFRRIAMVDKIESWFNNPWFREKYVVYVPL